MSTKPKKISKQDKTLPEFTEPKNKDLGHYQANIDLFDGSLFHGWAFNIDKPNDAVLVEIFFNGILLAQGLANDYRDDLLKAGKGNGKHAFKLSILQQIPHDLEAQINVMCGGQYPVKMLDSFNLVLKSGCTGFFHGLDGIFFNGSFISSQPFSSTEITYTLSIDGKFVDKFTASTDDRLNCNFHCKIPSDYFDGNAHAIQISLDTDYACQISAFEFLRPILTPWHLISKANDASVKYFGSLSHLEIKRLESYESQLRDLTKKKNLKDLLAITDIYEILSEGPKIRKQYQPISLPTNSGQVDVSIIIPVHNKFEYTYYCLASLIFSATKCSYEVILVDDCSTDSTTEIREIVKNIKVIENKENLGFLRSCNKAAKQAKGKYILLLNNDTEVCNGFLDEMLGTFASNPNAGAVGAKLLNPDGSLQEAGGIVWDNGQPWNLGRNQNSYSPEWNYVRNSDYLSGAVLLVSNTAWKKVNGLSEEFAPCYFEDTDLAFKLRANGYTTLYNPHAEVIHFEGVSHGKDVNSGMKAQQLINAPKFSSKWFKEFAHNGRMSEENIWRNKDREIRYRCLVIDYATPEPDKNAGAYAAVQEMQLLQANGFKLTFIPENHAHFGKYTTDLQKIGIECIHAPFYISIEEFLKKRGKEFDMVYITRYSVAESYIDLIRKYTDAKVLLNIADLHFLRELRSYLAQNKTDLAEPLATRDRELSVLNKVDAILSYSESEHAAITSHILTSKNIFKCPWVAPIQKHQNKFKQRSGIAFLGGYNHLPNVEAVDFLVQKIMPALKIKNPDIKLYIYGSNPPDSFKKYSSENVEVVGYVENLESVFEEHRIFVAPLLSGAGIKGKVIDSISRGVPSILSPIAIEATGLVDGISTLVAESENEWVTAIMRLHSDETLWNKLSENSLELVATAYSPENARKQFSKPLNYLGFYSSILKTN